MGEQRNRRPLTAEGASTSVWRNVRARARDLGWQSSPIMASVLIRAYRARFGVWPNVFKPRTFNEKLLFRMMFDRRPVLTTLAGKFESRAYVAARLGNESLLPALLGVVRGEDELGKVRLPTRYIMKASHASGLLRIVTPETPISHSEMVTLVRRWLATDYGKDRLEWCYKGLERIVVFEELLLHDGIIPSDYKFFCFDGRVIYIQVDSTRHAGHTQSIFDADWNKLDVRVQEYSQDAVPPPRPASLDTMIAIAERLSGGLDFVRVDLYDVGGEVRVGELTNYPQGGCGRFYPDAWDLTFGRHWTLPPFAVLRRGGRRSR